MSNPDWSASALAAGTLTRAGLRLAVFPLPPGSKTAEPGWTRRVTMSLAVIGESWPAGANIGVACRASGIVGLDLDRHAGSPDGVASFARLCAARGQPCPETFTVATPSGGLHLYFRVPPGTEIGSPIGWLPGVDVRGPGHRSGGYLAGPGSVTAAGEYQVARDQPIAPLPAWLSRLLTLPAKPPVRRPA
jgi:hypothetical protein